MLHDAFSLYYLVNKHIEGWVTGFWWERERKWGRGNKRTQRIERETREKKRL